MLAIMNIAIKKLHPQAVTPIYQSDQAAGADLHACLDSPVTLAPRETALIPTGIAIALPSGYEAQVRSRSGLAAKNSIVVLNSPGTVDSDYRGEVKVILINHSREDFVIQNGDRIAQLVIARHETANFTPTDELDKTTRGSGGFGSTKI